MPSLYIHIPFCKTKCPYCSFVSLAGKEDVIDAYLDALGREASRYRAAPIETVYIGGGTPTLLSIPQLERLFDMIRSNFCLGEDAEWSFEANPATFDFKKARRLREGGANRVSLGVQSFNDASLRYLGRPHSGEDAERAFHVLKEAGFANINLDFIYSLPGQTNEEIEEDLGRFISMGSQHVCAYMLTVTEDSFFARQGLRPVCADEQREQFLFVSARLKDHGFRHYEVSNFAKEEMFCRHNLATWQSQDYIGLGAGAHSHFSGHRFWNSPDIDLYIRAMTEGESAKTGSEVLTPSKRLKESLCIGLRLTEGVCLRALEEKHKKMFSFKTRETIKALAEAGFLMEEGKRLKATQEGMLVLDEIGIRLI